MQPTELAYRNIVKHLIRLYRREHPYALFTVDCDGVVICDRTDDLDEIVEALLAFDEATLVCSSGVFDADAEVGFSWARGVHNCIASFSDEVAGMVHKVRAYRC